MTSLDLNRQLAELLGWTNITELGGSLIGTPPASEPQCRGQAKVPDWSGDWRDCGPLVTEYGEHITNFFDWVIAHSYSSTESKDSLTRQAVVRFVIDYVSNSSLIMLP